MIEDWKRVLSTRAAEWGLPAVGEWNVLFHNNYHPSVSTINLLWFHRDERFPRAVTKMNRDRDALTREFDNLQALYRLAPRHVPRPLHLGEADGFGMLWMEGVPGYCIPPGGRYSASSLARSVDVLASIHRAVNKGVETSGADRHARMVAAPVASVLRHETSRAVREGCLALLETATPEWLTTLPVIPQHGDLYLDNVFCYRDERHIIDWEDFGAIDLPYYDLLTLLHSFLRASANEPEHWDARLKKQIPPLIERYARGASAPAPAIGVFLPITLVNRYHYHWAQGHAVSTIYADIEHYFEHTAYWQDVFAGN
jgi:hypothetical protein